MPFTAAVTTDCHAGLEPPLGVTLVTPLLIKSSFLLVQVWHFQIFQKYIYFVCVFQLINTELFGEIACYLLCAFFFFENLKYFNTVQISEHGSFQLLLCQTGRQGPRPRLRLLFVCDDQGVKASAASSFKLHIILTFLDLDRSGMLSPGCEQKALDFLSFAWRGDKVRRAGTSSSEKRERKSSL